MTYDAVNALMTAICDSIRTKTGSTDKIPHQSIPQQILDIPTSTQSTIMFSSGIYTTTSDFRIVRNQYTDSSLRIVHGLPVRPNCFHVWAEDLVEGFTYPIGAFVRASYSPYVTTSGRFTRTYNTSLGMVDDVSSYTAGIPCTSVDDIYLIIGSSNGANVIANVRYHWIACKI